MSKAILNKLQDKTSYIHIFAALLKNPTILSEYPIRPTDFPEKFHRILFSAIHNLKENGVLELSDVTIDGYLSNVPTQHQTFTDGCGIDYINACLERGEPSNFEYHYDRMKKFALLRDYVGIGINIDDIYSIAYKEADEEAEQNRKFNEMSLEQIMRHFDTKIAMIKDNYVLDIDGFGGHSAQNVDSILERAFQQPNVGAPFQSGFYNTATRGARRRKFYCQSGNTGSGKTRGALADMAYQCIPIIYDKTKDKWIFTGNRERGLFISTELEEEEIVMPLLCYIANVDEDDVDNMELTPEENARLIIAKEILRKSHFYLEILFDFDSDDLSHLIQKYVSKYDVGYVFFDYLQTTIKMFESMSKRGAKGLQEHQLLRILSVHLKNMCNKYNIWIGTATQLNDKWKDDGNINLDQSAVAGSKAIADKLDVGAIQIKLTAKDEKLWDSIKNDVKLPMGIEPTHTKNIYKNRGNRWLLIRIWVHFDMGTLRMTDCFVTDYKGKLIKMKGKQFLFDDGIEVPDMTADEVLDFLTDKIDELDIEKEEYKDTKFDQKTEEDMKQQLESTYAEVGYNPNSGEYTEDNIDEVFPTQFEEDTPSFGDTKKESLW